MRPDRPTASRRPVRAIARRVARAGAAVCVAVVATLATLAAGPAFADPPMRFRDLPPDQRRQVVRERFESLPAGEQDRIRERIRYERSQGGGQLSPEQRRQLRQDIMQHGREVYGPRPHHR
jgi:hypothetical protein